MSKSAAASGEDESAEDEAGDSLPFTDLDE
jgi:hypothetical protein